MTFSGFWGIVGLIVLVIGVIIALFGSRFNYYKEIVTEEDGKIIKRTISYGNKSGKNSEDKDNSNT